MTLAPGTRLGPYEILSALGAGGMGEVYRATDTSLKRQVAIKVMPAAVAADVERLARFQREAEVLAALNHPNIGHIHGLEKSGGTIALVMELVEGPTLADRIGKGPIPLDETLPIARQIAEALEAAHEQGIVHRDLKPENIKVRPDGTVKVLDFGLAKAVEPAGSRPDVSQSPTITTPAMTAAGMILGTAAYMSPEQAKGGAVDKRTDLWAFGCVLYEMLTGQRAFAGEDVSDTLAAVLRGDPDWTALPANAPPPIRRLLRRCLEKDRSQRLADAADARLEVHDALTAPAMDALAGAAAVTASTRSARRAWLACAAAVLVAAGLALPTVRYLREASVVAPLETRVDIVTPTTSDPASFALSPDGRQLVFVAAADGTPRLWLRSLEAATAQPLAATDGASSPFWSPDSRSVGFFAGGQLQRLDLGGGAPRILAAAPAGRGGTWNADGVLLFAPTSRGPLFRVAASGGAATAVTRLERQPGSHSWPVFLPDGRHFLFHASGRPGTPGIYLGALDAGAPTRLTETDTAGVYLPGGWLLWVRAGTLVAQKLELGSPVLTGDAVTVADGVAVASNRIAVTVSATGLVAYRVATVSRRQLTWRERTGAVLGRLGQEDSSLQNPSVARDGRRVAASRSVQGTVNLWLLDGPRMGRFTFGVGVDRYPVWSPDGHRIVFGSTRAGIANLYVKDVNSESPEALLVESAQFKVPNDWSLDGQFLLYTSTDPQTGRDLWVRPMVGDTTPWAVLKTQFSETHGRFSPDGRWVAYQSDESGRPEIYVLPFRPASGQSLSGAETESAANATNGRLPVSTAGGTFPSWRPDGQALYYLSPSGEILAATITVRGLRWSRGAGVALFNADRRRRHGHGWLGPAVRRHPRWPLPNQRRPRRCLSHADHAHPALATRVEEVAKSEFPSAGWDNESVTL